MSATALATERIRLNTADTAAARVVLIKRGDLRPRQGWRGGPVKPEFFEPGCRYFHPKDGELVVTGAATTKWDSPNRSLLSAANILQNASMVRRRFALATSLSGLQCTVRSPIIGASVERVGAGSIFFPRLTPQTAAYRANYTAADGARRVVE